MFSIVTANWNGEKLLQSFLASLQKQTFNDFKIYIIDNGSQDNSIEIINSFSEKLDLKIVKLDHNFGFSVANNIGINEAFKDDNRYIVTLNNDLELDKNCLFELKNTIEMLNNEFDVFQILLLNYYQRDSIDAAGIIFNRYYIAKQVAHKEVYSKEIKFNSILDGVCAGAAVYSKKCLKDVESSDNEFFDSKFFAYYEDVDLALRLKNRGYRSILAEKAIAYHIHSGTSGKNSFFKEYYLSRNQLYYLRKNLKSEVYTKFKPIYFLCYFKKIFKLLLMGRFKAIIGVFKGLSDYKKM